MDQNLTNTLVNLLTHHLVRPFVYRYIHTDKHACMHSLNIIVKFSSFCAGLNVGKRQVHFHLVVRFPFWFVSFSLHFPFSPFHRHSRQHPNSLNFSTMDLFLPLLVLRNTRGREKIKTVQNWYDRSRKLRAALILIFFPFSTLFKFVFNNKEKLYVFNCNVSARGKEWK